VNRLARRGELHPGSELYGKAFENWVFHELTAFSNYRGCDSALSYWRLASGIEVDFVLGDMAVAIEAKSTVLVRLASSSPSSSIVFIIFYWKAE
jgi:predicted AAA+ superfamily ATPase